MEKPKIAVAMSGGVDSSVAASLLLERGYEVIGLTMRLWQDSRFEEKAEQMGQGCCSWQDINDARRVAEKLDIAHYPVNFKEKFRREVVDYFIAEYSCGRTPNPCIVCNQKIKFGSLLQKSFELGAVGLATGHYVRSGWDSSRKCYYLQKGLDSGKDQSYMLYHLTQNQLSYSFFPLGELKKKQVRQKASELELPVAAKDESQEVCFIPGNDYREFLRHQLGEFEPGPILDTQGHKLGEHHGLPFYTIGQRRGLGITAAEPLYVVEIRPADNAIIVGRKEETYASGLLATSLNFICEKEPENPIPVKARIRYQADEVPALLYPPHPNGKACLEFETPQQAVTPGQAVAFYLDESELFGGGIIFDELPSWEKFCGK